jgi:hypothetical protein
MHHFSSRDEPASQKALGGIIKMNEATKAT